MNYLSRSFPHLQDIQWVKSGLWLMLRHSGQKPTVAGRACVLQDSLGFPCPASVLRLHRTLLLDNYSVSDRCLFCKVSFSRGLQKFLTDSCVPSFPSYVGRRPLADCVHVFLTRTLLPYYHFASRLADEELCPSALGREGGKKPPGYPEFMVSVAEETAVLYCGFHALTLHFCCVRFHMFLIHVVVIQIPRLTHPPPVPQGLWDISPLHPPPFLSQPITALLSPDSYIFKKV